MRNLKNFLISLNKKTIMLLLALVTILGAMTFGGLSVLNSGKKGASIETPEISTDIGGEVSASYVTVSVYVRTYNSSGTYTDSKASGTSCGTIKAYASYASGTTVLSGSGSTTFDMKGGFLGTYGDLCGLVAERTGNYYYLGLTSGDDVTTPQRNYFKFTGTAGGQSFSSQSTYGTAGVKGAYVDKGSGVDFSVNFYFIAPITVTLSVNSTTYGRIRQTNSTSGTLATSISVPYKSSYSTSSNRLTINGNYRYAVPASHLYYFSGWSTKSGTVTKPFTITATFSKNTFINVTQSLGYTSLVTAITNATSNDVIEIRKTGSIAESINADKNLTIRNGDTYVPYFDQCNIYVNTGCTLTLVGNHYTNGSLNFGQMRDVTVGGDFCDVYGTLNLTGINFKLFACQGAFLYVSPRGTINSTNCTFSNCGRGERGFINIDGTANFTNFEFDNCDGYPEFIYVGSNGRVTFDTGTFSGCAAETAIDEISYFVYNSGTCSFIDTTISECSSAMRGFYNSGIMTFSGESSIDTFSFDGREYGNYGADETLYGAIYNISDDTSAIGVLRLNGLNISNITSKTLTAEGSTLEGIAITNYGTVTGSGVSISALMLDNLELVNGAAIYNASGASFDVESVTIDGSANDYPDNVYTAEYTPCSNYGGAIYNAGTFAVDTLNITNCYAVNGGAIYNTGTFTHTGEESKIESCYSCYNNSNSSELGQGGGVYSTGSFVNEGNLSFSYCYTDGGQDATNGKGGAFYIENGGITNSGTLDIADCSANAGGGIYFRGTIEFSNTGTIKVDCCSASNGAGIYFAGTVDADITMNNLELTTNETSDHENGKGGAIYSINHNLTLTDVWIYNNYAGTMGGGIYQYGGSLTITNGSSGSKIHENSTGMAGGGICVAGASAFNISSESSLVEISGNSSDTYGGGIALNSVDTVNMSGFDIGYDNDNDIALPNSARMGGGLYVYLCGTVTLGIEGKSSYIEYNTTSDYSGAGAVIDCDDLTMINCYVYENESGGSAGGLYIGDMDNDGEMVVAITNCEINDNTATGNGGGIYFYYVDEVTITDCQIYSNTAADGGAIYSAYSAVTITKTEDGETSIHENTSNSGTIAFSGTLTLDGGVLIQNNTAASCSAIDTLNGDSNLIINDANITGNVSTSQGETCAIYIWNEATIKGGVISNDGCFADICVGDDGGTGDVIIEGNPQISKIYIYVSADRYVTRTGNTADNHPIEFILDEYNYGTTVVQYEDIRVTDGFDKYTLADTTKGLVLVNDKLVVGRPDVNEVYLHKDWQNLISGIDDPGNPPEVSLYFENIYTLSFVDTFDEIPEGAKFIDVNISSIPDTTTSPLTCGESNWTIDSGYSNIQVWWIKNSVQNGGLYDVYDVYLYNPYLICMPTNSCRLFAGLATTSYTFNNFSVKYTTNLSHMFEFGCFTELDISSWEINTNITTTDMFIDCNNLARIYTPTVVGTDIDLPNGNWYKVDTSVTPNRLVDGIPYVEICVENRASYIVLESEITFVIRFHGNGATSGSMDDQVITYNTPVELFENQYVRTGFSFLHWSETEDNQGAKYSDLHYLNADTINYIINDCGIGGIYHIYAQWAEPICRVEQTYFASLDSAYDYAIREDYNAIYITVAQVDHNVNWDIDSGDINLYSDVNTVITISSDYFATVTGGSQFTISSYEDNTITITSGKTLQNAAIMVIDGYLYLSSVDVTLDNIHSANTNGSSMGGAVYIEKGAGCDIYSGNITNCSADFGGGIYNRGYLYTEASLNMTGNSARAGGGNIYNTGTLEVYGGAIEDGVATFGGNIYNSGEAYLDEKVTIAGGEANHGAGIDNNGGKLYLYAVNMYNNSGTGTDSLGGAIYNNNGELYLRSNNEVLIKENSATYGSDIWSNNTVYMSSENGIVEVGSVHLAGSSIIEFEFNEADDPAIDQIVLDSYNPGRVVAQCANEEATEIAETTLKYTLADIHYVLIANGTTLVVDYATFNIVYNANTGTGTMDDTVAQYNNEVTLSQNLFEKANHDFVGWAESADGEVVYLDSQTLTVEQVNEIFELLADGKDSSEGLNYTIYAIWTGKIYVITLNPNGGIGGTEYIYEKYGDAFYLDRELTQKMSTSANGVEIPSRAAYSFAGYYNGTISEGVVTLGNSQYLSNNGFIVNGLSATTFTEDTTIFAKWVALPYTITFDSSIYNNYNDILDNGTITPSTYNISNETITANVVFPSRVGYGIVPENWEVVFNDTEYGDTENPPTLVYTQITIPAGTYGNLVVKVKDGKNGWEALAYSVTFKEVYNNFEVKVISTSGTLLSTHTITPYNNVINGIGFNDIIVTSTTKAVTKAPNGTTFTAVSASDNPTRNGYTWGMANGGYLYTLKTNYTNGYRWDGAAWYNGTGNSTGFNSGCTSFSQLSATGGNNVEITLQWRPNTYTITYDSNGSGQTAVTQTVTYDATFTTKPSTTFSRTGYDVVSWSTATGYTDGDFTEFNTQYTYNVIGDITLYMVWEAHTFNIVFDGNGSTDGEMNNLTVTYGRITYLPMNILVKTGYNFDGWATSEGGTVAYEDNAQLTVEQVNALYTQVGKGGEYKLFAVWSAGSLEFASQTITPDAVFNTAYTSNPFDGATGGTGNYSYAIASGAPTGITLDSATRVFSGTPTSNVGTYQIQVVATDITSGASATAIMTLEVIKADIELSIDINSREELYYGNRTSATLTATAGANFAISYSDGANTYISAAVNNSKLYIVGIKAGGSDMVVTITASLANYNSASVTYTVGSTIKRLINDNAVTATLSPSSFTYDGTAKQPSITLTARIFTADSYLDTKSVTLVAGTDYTGPTYSNNINVTDSAKATVNGAGNYSNTRTELFSIVKAGSSIDWSLGGGDLIYGETSVSNATYNGDGTLSVTSADENYVKASISGKTITLLAVGYKAETVAVTLSATAGANYGAPSSVTVQVHLGKRNITVASDSAEKTYDGTALTKHSAKITSGSLASFDGVTDTIAYAFTGTQTNAGSSENTFTATIKHSSNDVTGYYNITYKNGTLTVNKGQMATPTVVWSKTNPGTATWNAVTHSGVTEVIYDVGLYYNDNYVENLADYQDTSYDFADIIRTYGAGFYVVEVSAIAGIEYENVTESEYGLSDELYATLIIAVVGDDGIATAEIYDLESGGWEETFVLIAGEQTEIRATENAGYTFATWSTSHNDVVVASYTTANTTITLNENTTQTEITITAKTQTNGYVVAVDASGYYYQVNETFNSSNTYTSKGRIGTLSVSPSGEQPYGTSITFTASSVTGYTFQGWYSANTFSSANFVSADATYTTTNPIGGITLYGLYSINYQYIDINWSLDGASYSNSAPARIFTDPLIVKDGETLLTATERSDLYAQYPYGSTFTITKLKIDGIYINFNLTTTLGDERMNVGIPLYTYTFNTNPSNYGSVDKQELILPKGDTYTTNNNVLTFNGGTASYGSGVYTFDAIFTDGRSVTATPKAADGYTYTFSSWSSTSGTATAAATITANFTQTANKYDNVFNAMGGQINLFNGLNGYFTANSGITSSFDPATSVLTINGTLSYGASLYWSRIDLDDFVEGDIITMSVTMVGGTYTGSVGNFMLDINKDNFVGMTPRHTASVGIFRQDLNEGYTVTTSLTITAEDVANGASGFDVWTWYNSDHAAAGIVFNNAQYKIIVTKSGSEDALTTGATYNADYGKYLPTATREGYDFAGWSTYTGETSKAGNGEHGSDAFGNYFVKKSTDTGTWWGLGLKQQYVEPGKTYTWALDVYVDGTRDIRSNFDANTTAGNYSGNDAAHGGSSAISLSSYIIPAGRWVRVSLTVTVVADADNPRIHHSFCPIRYSDETSIGEEGVKIYYKNSSFWCVDGDENTITDISTFATTKVTGTATYNAIWTPKTYTLTIKYLDANNAIATDTAEVTYDKDYMFSSYTVYKPYTIAGWTTTPYTSITETFEGEVVGNRGRAFVTGDATYYSVLKLDFRVLFYYDAQDHSARFNDTEFIYYTSINDSGVVNGYINFVANKTHDELEAKIIANGDSVTAGYTLAGWGKSSGVTTPDPEYATTIGNTADHYSWYGSGYFVRGVNAVWERTITHTVNYNANGHGTAPNSASVEQTQYANSKLTTFSTVAMNITTGTMSAAAYKFDGWSTTASGSVTHNANTSYNFYTTGADYTYNETTGKFDDDTTLYAVWSATNYTITVNAGTGGSGGSASPNTYTISNSAQTVAITLPTRLGYAITSWTVTGHTGTIPTVNGTTLTIPANTYGNLTLTPTWTIQEAKIGNTYYLTLEEAFENAEADDEIVIVVNNVAIDTIEVDKAVTLTTEKNVIITRNGTATMFILVDGAKLVVKGSTSGQTISIQGNRVLNGSTWTNNDSTDSAFTVDTGATLDLNSGVIVEKHYSTDDGVAIWNAGEVNIAGATIRDNYTEANGTIYNIGELNFDDGLIENNTAELAGGAIYNDSEYEYNEATEGEDIFSSIVYTTVGVVNISGGAISDNSSFAGMAIFNRGNLNISGGEIRNHTRYILPDAEKGQSLLEKFKCSTIFVYAGTVEMSDGLIFNNTSWDGGAISIGYRGSYFVMTGGEIYSNTADNSGGGIFNSSGAVYLLGGEIYDNSASADGGGVYNGGYLYIGTTNTVNEQEYVGTGVTITGNSANDGGGIHAISDMTIEQATITDNTAFAGGALFVSQNGTTATLSGENITMSGNSADNGGAIYVSIGSILQASDFTMTNNSASQNGGAIYAASGSVYVTNMTFTANKASNGAAIYGAEGSYTEVRGSLFDQHTSSKSGNTIGKGGAIYVATAEIYDSTFTRNSAETGGAIYATHETLVQNSIFGGDTESLGNTSTSDGGAIYGDTTGSLTVNESTFKYNTAGGKGGAIYKSTLSLSIDTCEFDHNTADGYGGAICYVASKATSEEGTFGVVDSTITNNTGSYGGGIYCSERTVANIQGDMILNSNTATADGGAICFWGEELNLVALEMNDNTANGSGGALLIKNGIASITVGATVTGNSAGVTGGAIRAETKANVDINDVSFDDHTANNGGTIYITTSNVYLYNATIKNSSADTEGNAVYLYSGYLCISGTTNISGDINVRGAKNSQPYVEISEDVVNNGQQFVINSNKPDVYNQTDDYPVVVFEIANNANSLFPMFSTETEGYKLLQGANKPGNLYFGAEYTITMDSGDATTPGSVSQDTYIVNIVDQEIEITLPINTGYTLSWEISGYEGDAPTISGTILTIPANTIGDIVLTAIWSYEDYTITYLDKNGDAFSGTHEAGYPTTHTYGTATTLKSASKTGYRFDGWFTTIDCSGTAVTTLGATAFTSDITLYAKWTAYTLTINYHLNGGVPVSGDQYFTNSDPALVQTFAYGTNVGQYGLIDAGPSRATRTGYTTTYRYNTQANGSGVSLDFSTVYEIGTGSDVDLLKLCNLDMSQSNAELDIYARWTANKYTVTYDMNGGAYVLPANSKTANGITVTQNADGTFKLNGTATASISTILSVNYLDKFTEGQVYTFNLELIDGTVTGEVTNSSFIVEISKENGGNLSTRNNCGKSPFESGTRTMTVSNLAATEGKCLVFKYWNGTSSVTFKNAVYRATIETGVDSAYKSVTYDSAYGTLLTPYRKGYTFAGWKLGSETGSAVTSTTTVATASNHTLVATWAIDTYTVTVLDNNKTGAESSYNVVYGNAYPSIELPYYAGYAIDGFYEATDYTATAIIETYYVSVDNFWRLGFKGSSWSADATALELNCTVYFKFTFEGDASGFTKINVNGVYLTENDYVINGNTIYGSYKVTSDNFIGTYAFMDIHFADATKVTSVIVNRLAVMYEGAELVYDATGVAQRDIYNIGGSSTVLTVWKTAEARIGEVYYGTLEEAFAAAVNGDTIYTLVSDISVEEQITVNKNVTLAADVDTTITRNGDVMLFKISSGYTFTIGVTTTDTHQLTINGNNKAEILIDISGSFVLNCGTLLGNGLENATAGGSAGAVRVYGSGRTFTMNGGTISGFYSTGHGGAVYVSGGTFTMNGGTIQNNTAASNGGAVFVSGTFVLNDGLITNNTAKYGKSVVVNSSNTVTFTMNGGTITDQIMLPYNNNSAESGTFYFYGGNVSSTAEEVAIYNQGKIVMGNTADSIVPTIGSSDAYTFQGIHNTATGTVTINEGFIYGNAYCIFNYGEATINGGEFYSNQHSNNIVLRLVSGSTTTVTGGTFTNNNTTNGNALRLDGASTVANVSGGTFSSKYYNYVSEGTLNLSGTAVFNSVICPLKKGTVNVNAGTGSAGLTFQNNTGTINLNADFPISQIHLNGLADQIVNVNADLTNVYKIHIGANGGGAGYSYYLNQNKPVVTYASNVAVDINDFSYTTSKTAKFVTGTTLNTDLGTTNYNTQSLYLVGQITVTYAPNGGTGTMNAQTFWYGVVQNLTTNAFTRSGHEFAGWATSVNGNVAYTDGQLAAFTADTTLYAKWSINSYTLTVNYYNFTGNTKTNILVDGITVIYPTTNEVTFNSTSIASDYSTTAMDITIATENTANKYVVTVGSLSTDRKSWDYEWTNSTTYSWTPTESATINVYVCEYFTIDINAYLNGSHKGNISGFATASGTTGDNSFANVKDYCYHLPYGSEYNITYTAEANHMICATNSSVASDYSTTANFTGTLTTKNVSLTPYVYTTYNIAFDGNNSTSGSTEQMNGLIYHINYNLNANGFERTGYTFAGWEYNIDISGIAFENGSIYDDGGALSDYSATARLRTVEFLNVSPNMSYNLNLISDNDIIIRGVQEYNSNKAWIRYNEFNENTGIFTTSGTTAYIKFVIMYRDTTTELDASILESSTLQFNSLYADGATITKLSSTAGETVTLFAHWVENTYSVTFKEVYNQFDVIIANTKGDIKQVWTVTAENNIVTGIGFTDIIITSTTAVTKAPDGTTFTAIASSDNPTRTGYTWGMANGGYLYTLKTDYTNGYRWDSASWYSGTGNSTGFNSGCTSFSQLSATDGSTVTMELLWLANTYTVTFDSNEGSECDSITVTYDSTYGTLPEPTRAGYIFAGWHIDSVDGPVVTSSTKVTTAQNHTLVAEWTLNEYTLFIDPNGGSYNGSADVTTIKQDFETEYEVLPPTRTGYNFLGWTFTGAGTFDANTNIYVFGAGNGTLTAQWELATVEVSMQFAVEGYTLGVIPYDGYYGSAVTVNTLPNVKANKAYSWQNAGKTTFANFANLAFDSSKSYGLITYNYGDKAELTITIGSEFILDSLIINGNVITSGINFANGVATYITSALESDAEILVKFARKQVTITLELKTLGSGLLSGLVAEGKYTSGVITADGTEIANGNSITKYYGDSSTFIIMPNAGYSVSSLIKPGESISVANPGMTYSVTVSFTADGTLSITLTEQETWLDYATEGDIATTGKVVITTPNQLAELAKKVLLGETVSSNIILGDNINLEDHYWFPIGTSSNPYTGNFNGDSFNITNMNVLNGTAVGLFGYNSGTVYNVKVSGTATGGQTVGGIVGENTGTVSYVANNVVVTGLGTLNTDSNSVGGVVGYNAGDIFASYNTASVTGNYYVGGIAGYNDGDLLNAYNTGSITNNATTNSASVGGIVGFHEGGGLGYVYNIGTISHDENVPYSNFAGNTALTSPGYYLSTLPGGDNDTGCALTQEQLQPISTAEFNASTQFAGWNSASNNGYKDNIWEINPQDNNGYAYPVFVLQKDFVGSVTISANFDDAEEQAVAFVKVTSDSGNVWNLILYRGVSYTITKLDEGEVITIVVASTINHTATASENSITLSEQANSVVITVAKTSIGTFYAGTILADEANVVSDEMLTSKPVETLSVEIEEEQLIEEPVCEEEVFEVEQPTEKTSTPNYNSNSVMSIEVTLPKKETLVEVSQSNWNAFVKKQD